MNKYQFLPLKDEKEFESLVNDLCVEKYGIEFQVYGRKGQKQNGIDGLSFSKDKKQIVYQCKNKIIVRDDKKIQAELLDDIATEVQSASTKFSSIDTFIFANSFKQDTVLQEQREVSIIVSCHLFKSYFPSNLSSNSNPLVLFPLEAIKSNLVLVSY